MAELIWFILFDLHFWIFSSVLMVLLISMAIYYFKFAWFFGHLKKKQLTKLGLGIGIIFCTYFSTHYFFNVLKYGFSFEAYQVELFKILKAALYATGLFIFLGAIFDANEKEEQNVDEINKEK